MVDVENPAGHGHNPVILAQLEGWEVLRMDPHTSAPEILSKHNSLWLILEVRRFRRLITALVASLAISMTIDAFVPHDEKVTQAIIIWTVLGGIILSFWFLHVFFTHVIVDAPLSSFIEDDEERMEQRHNMPSQSKFQSMKEIKVKSENHVVNYQVKPGEDNLPPSAASEPLVKYRVGQLPPSFPLSVYGRTYLSPDKVR